MKSISLHDLYMSIGRVSSEAVLNQLQIKKPSLRKYLRESFSGEGVSDDSFLSDPLIESTFSWASAGGEKGENTMTDLAAKGVLSEKLVKVMDQAPVNSCRRTGDEERGIQRYEYDDEITEDEDSRWPADRPPYRHQLDAWKILGQKEPRSVVVTAGTGSGKSECFMVPMLNDMAKQVDEGNQTLVGIQAIMLYPLNALINSQRDRLIGWTRGFEGKVRFALYNGETPKTGPGNRSESQTSWHGSPKLEEVKDRESIRYSPPPILVTNATMLEYMLVRPEDRPIIEKSQGTLRWIILDEAHTLVGSSAAETSLLLRRTMYAFGVNPKDVRFVATSATIGDASKQKETDQKLKAFLAQLAGVSTDQIDIVRGHRNIPELPEYDGEPDPNQVEQLEKLTSSEGYDLLSQMTLMRNLRKRIIESPMTIGDISDYLKPESTSPSEKKKQLSNTLQLIDSATNAYPDGDSNADAFLPVRAHLFHRAQSGIWSCVNPDCCDKKGTPLEDNWPFGKVYLRERQTCECCNYPVYELTHCSKCNEPSLNAVRYLSDTNISTFKPRELLEFDEFSDEIEHENVETVEPLSKQKRDQLVQIYTSHSEIHNRHRDSGSSVEAYLKAPSGEISHTKTDGVKIKYTIAENGSKLRCACCNTTESEEGRIFKRAILGSPFLMGNIVPEMLRHVPADSPTSMAGRRLITFTDSRQGTARFSARLQLDAERRWTRSTVYRYLINSRPDKELINPEIEDEIKKYEQAKVGQNDVVKSICDEKIAELRGTIKSDAKPVSWDDFIEILSDKDEIRLLSGYGDFSEDQLPGEYADRDESLDSPKSVARLFLLREFARRPLNSNNLESLGLVKVVYPAIRKLTETSVREKNHEWFDMAFTFDQWLIFLKIFLDFFVREETIIDLKPSEKNWMGARLYGRLLQKQNFVFNSDPNIKKQQQAAYKIVPSSREKRPHRLVRLLELSSNRSVEFSGGDFDKILDNAFETLKDLGILEWVEFDERDLKVEGKQVTFKRQGYHLKVKSLAFEPIDYAHLCPLTHRWLDTVMSGPGLKDTNGITPLMTGNLQLDDVLIKEERFDMPRPEKSFLRLDPENCAKLSEWISNDENIEQLRSKGLWRDLNDAAINHPMLLRSKEHSAQLASSKLKHFEKAFKNDALNVLNCSTTMEMGVDIGSLSMVAMNNTPPSTANYLQRAGRAGRRGQSTSVVLTFCKATPHGERIFADPHWPFSSIPVPKVALDSTVIVRRHVNAYLLSQYLVSKFANDSLPTMKAGKFFTSDYEYTMADLFINWLDNSASEKATLIRGLNTLIVGTALEGLSITSIIQKCQTSIQEVMDHWIHRHDALKNIIEDSDEYRISDDGRKIKDFAYLRLAKQLDSMEDEYLLGLLANRGFLPGYGFPTNVVELVTNNFSEKLSKNKKHKSNPDYPKRSLDVAIREFEPGKDIVLNGAVYRSAGLQLAWKIPETEAEIKRNQLLRYMAHCRCGYHTSGYDSAISLPSNCPECGSYLSRKEYLIPTGFQVDYKESLHNDYTRPEYAEYKAPLVSIDDAEWQSLGKLDYGRFRATQSGNVFHYNDGQGAGYAFCWHCGRTHTVETTPDIDGNLVISDRERSRIVAKHKRLQGTSARNNENCPNEPWSIKVGKINEDTQSIDMPVVFGFSSTTTMLELQLRNPLKHSWIKDKTLGTSLGIAIRMAFSRLEGLSDAELGTSIQTRSSPEGVSTTSIFIFDKTTQGAGYATQIAERMPEVLRAAYDYVINCTHECEKVCHSCLLDFETQHQVENIDRHEVIKYFDETNLLQRLTVPEHRRYLGEKSEAELLNGQSLLSLKGSRAKEIDLFVSGSDWEIADHPALRKLKFLSGQKVRLLISDSVTESLDADLAWQLQRSLDESVSVSTFKHPVELKVGAYPLLRLVIDDTEFWYVTDDSQAISLNEYWGNTTSESLVSGKNISLKLVTSEIELAGKANKSEIASNFGIIEDFRSLDCPINEFGDNFSSIILEATPLLDAALVVGIKKITYRDRYITSPLAIMLLIEILQSFTDKYGIFISEVETCHPSPDRKNQSCPADNFMSTDEWQEFMSGAADVHDLSIFSEFQEKRELPHGRELVIQTKSGEQYRLLLDQGLGHWCYRSSYSRINFNFNECYSEGESYRESDIMVKGGTGNTYLVIHKLG